MNIIVGSGPNGLAAAIVLAQAGLNVTVHEGASVAGGATRSGELTLPGFVHDLGSAVHPMAVTSPFFSKLPLEKHGLKWIWPGAALAHPFDDGTAVTIERDIGATATQFGSDGNAYRKLFEPLAKNWAELADGALRPIGWPKHPFQWLVSVIRALQPAAGLARSLFRGERARAKGGRDVRAFEPATRKLIEREFRIDYGRVRACCGLAKNRTRRLGRVLRTLLCQYSNRSAVASEFRLGFETLLESPGLTLCD